MGLLGGERKFDDQSVRVRQVVVVAAVEAAAAAAVVDL